MADVYGARTAGPEDQAPNRLLGYSDYSPFVPTFGDGTEEVTPSLSKTWGASSRFC